MSHPNRWRCPCGADLGVVRTAGRETTLDVDRAVRRFLFSDRHAVAVCPDCGAPAEFRAQESAGTMATMMTG
jgi:hypothetical protein